MVPIQNCWTRAEVWLHPRRSFGGASQAGPRRFVEVVEVVERRVMPGMWRHYSHMLACTVCGDWGLLVT